MTTVWISPDGSARPRAACQASHVPAGSIIYAVDAFLKAVDKWRDKQEDEPSRAEAIRRLVELGLRPR